MRGPHILARTLARSPAADTATLASWTLLFDALLHCDALQRDASAGRIFIGLDRPMVGPVERRLTATVERRARSQGPVSRPTFAALADTFDVALGKDDRARLSELPTINCEFGEGEVAEVVAALCAACSGEDMSPTAMHAEIVATRHLLQRHQPCCIGVSYGVVASAHGDVLPWLDALADIESPSAARDLDYIVGATVIDGPPWTPGDSAPLQRRYLHYERMVHTFGGAYRRRAPC